MKRQIPKIKIQSPSQVEASMARDPRNLFNRTPYAELNRAPQLLDTSPPFDFYDSNVSNGSLFFTAFDETPSLEDEDEPPYIDLDKDLTKPKSSQNLTTSIYQTPSSTFKTLDATNSFIRSRFSTPQASSTQRPDFESLSEDMSSVNLTEMEELVEDPFFSSLLSDFIDGAPVESEIDFKKLSVIELFDRLCMKEQDRYRKLMKTKTENDDFAKVNLETLDYETTFIDLSNETSELPPNSVSTAINCLTRAEIKNEIYQAMTKDTSGQMKFNLVSEAKSSAFIPETKGNVEILTYLGSTGHEKNSSRNTESQKPSESKKWGETMTFSDSQEMSSSADQSSLKRPMSRWGNVSNLADST